MKNILLSGFLILGLMLPISLLSQAAFLEKPESFDPSKSCKILVNLRLTSNDWGIVDIAQTEDMYLWIWKPKEHPAGHPLANGIGGAAWKNSNEALKMTKESEGVYSFTFTPTEFFETTPANIYKEDFHFLLKPKDGGGYGDPDRKTEDLSILVDPPAGPIVKFLSIPMGKGDKKDTIISGTDDVFSVVYNNSAEEKVSMQNPTELYAHVIAYDETGASFSIAANARRAGDFPQLKMKQTKSQIFQYSFIPEKLFEALIPSGRKIFKIEIQIVKPNLRTTSDMVDGTLVYYFNQGGC
jgi:hypothetical protein